MTARLIFLAVLRERPDESESELEELEDSELDEDEECSPPPSRPEGRLWSGHDLQVVCRQNSAIPALLAYLRVGLGENGHANGHANGPLRDATTL